ncbi:MAG TPA: DUF4105 domain-containing protein [Polyangia bacterium]|nr:DUF4105 domain-containing protein [Polyangia bacterium]
MLAGVAAAARWLLAAATLTLPPAAAKDVDALVSAARSRHLADTRDWQVLLHYRRTLGGGWKSEADGLGFFLAGATGQRDPDAELAATLRAFFAPGPADDEHAQCRFPARWDWLQRQLGIDPARAPHPVCHNYDFWRVGISAQAATLVYATAFINSPASMYGHTFLRLSRSTGEGNPLLDYIVNFAADVNTKSGILYAARGLTGGFPGRFYVMPYYFKVQEYSNIESRDLWEYELSLTPEQVRRLVMHAWETRTTRFDYLFLTRNCSYQLLSLLEVADPNLHLTDEFHGVVIPANTVRAVLAVPGLVRRIGGRPSLMTIMKRRKARLAGGEADIAAAWATAVPGAPVPPLPAGAPPERQALILDAATDYLRFQERGAAEPGELDKLRERRLLLARGRLGVPPQETVTLPAVAAPETGHASMRVAAGAGVGDQGGPFQTLSWRGAIHDDLDPPRGYPAGARLEMGEVRLRFEDRPRRIGLDRVDLIDIVSAGPFDAWVKSASWKVWVGADNAREIGCEQPGSPHAGWRCLYGGATTGGGIALSLGRQAMLLMLAETDLGAGPAFSGSHDFRLGGGGEARLTGGGDRWRFELGARAIYYALGARGAVLRTRALQSLRLSRSFAARAGAETDGAYAQATVELAAYF